MASGLAHPKSSLPQQFPDLIGKVESPVTALELSAEYHSVHSASYSQKLAAGGREQLMNL